MSVQAGNEPELQEPPLRITVAGMRWYGDDWKVESEGATMDFHSTDNIEATGELLQVLRKLAVKRANALMAVLGLTWEALDWDRPDAPMEADMGQLVFQGESLLEALRVLRELAPQLIEPQTETGGDDGR